MPKNDINYNRLGVICERNSTPKVSGLVNFATWNSLATLQNTVVTLPNKKIPRYYRRKDLIEVRRDRSG